MKVYIACGLTHVPRPEFSAYCAFIDAVAARLSADNDVRYALRDSDPQLASKPMEERARLCYLWDREMVEWADVLVADATYPSIGLGIELQLAENHGKPIIICFNRAAKNAALPVEYVTPDSSRHILQIGEGYVSLMALGLPGVFRVIGYDSIDEGLSLICAALSLQRKT